jgi:26S proteasome regulatory subunit N13
MISPVLDAGILLRPRLLKHIIDHIRGIQDASNERDEEFAFHINRLLQIPGYIPVWGVTDSTSQTPGASTSAQTTAPTRYSPTNPLRASIITSRCSASQPTAQQLSQLRSLVAQAQMSGAAAGEPGESSLCSRPTTLI